ncbi:MAG: hypothetical protein LUC44_06065 [Prevotellaceae bacterium]|nr:hypothetical protein [Prevotellaceae bacterium]
MVRKAVDRLERLVKKYEEAVNAYSINTDEKEENRLYAKLCETSMDVSDFIVEYDIVETLKKTIQ